MLPLKPLLYVILTAFALLVTGQQSCFDLTLYHSLKNGCSSARKFCDNLIAPTPRPRYSFPASTFLTTSTYTQPLTEPTTIYKTKYTATFVKRKTQTKTVAQATTTVSACNSVTTCGVVERVPTAPLLQACSCIRSVSYVYKTTTYSHTLVTSYKYTTTVTSTEKKVLTTTYYPTKTKKVPVKTAYACASVAPPAQDCNNQNHQWALYTLTKKDVNKRVEDWNLDYYKTQQPIANGTSPQIGFIVSSYTGRLAGIADIAQGPCLNDYINDRAYLYAPQTGIYTFSIPAYAQAVFLWIGDLAYSGYNVTNAFLSATATNNIGGFGPLNRKFLEAGTYTPIRYAYRCNQSDFDFFQNIIKPDGNYLFGQYSKPKNDYDDYVGYTNYYPYPDAYADTLVVNSSYIVQNGCGADSALAPPFPDWGNES